MKKKNNLSLDTQKLLVFRLVAKQDIILLRHKWKIPVQGFNLPEDFMAWNIEHIKPHASAKLSTQKDPDDYIFKKISYKNPDSKNIFFSYSYAFSSKLIEDIDNLLQKFGLSLNFRERTLWLIIYNRDLFSVNKRAWISYSNNKRSIEITIFPDTTIKDIQAIWKEVSDAQDFLKGIEIGKQRNKSSSNFDMQFRIYELRLAGNKLKDISQIVKLEFGKTIMDYELSGIITRFEKKYLAYKDSL